MKEGEGKQETRKVECRQEKDKVGRRRIGDKRRVMQTGEGGRRGGRREKGE